MKICRLVSYLPGLKEMSVGAPSGIYNLTKAQARKGHNITIITGGGKSDVKYEEEKNIKIYRVPSIDNCYSYSFLAARLLKNLKEKFDVYHAHDWQVGPFNLYNKFMQKKKLIAHCHGVRHMWLKEGVFKLKLASIENKIERIKFNLDMINMILNEKIAYKSANAVLAYSEASKKDLINLFKIPAEKIFVIYNGVDTGFFKPINKKTARKKLGLDINSKIILSIDDLRKGSLVLNESFKTLSKECKNLKLITIGGSSKFEKENIISVGRIPFTEMPLYYSACDFFVLPTLYEGFPKTLLESLSCGRPVVTTNYGGIPEIVNNGVGFLCECNNVNQLTEKIKIMLENTSLCNKMGLNGRRYVCKNFTWQKFAERVEKAYDYVLKS